MLNDAAMQARDQAKAEGRGFFGQWEDQLKATVNYTKRYLTMDPNTVLAESPGNFALDNQGIREVKIHLKNQQNMHRQHTHEFSIELVSAQGNYEFHMGEHNQFVELLKQVYGERVKMPFGYFQSHGVRVKLF